MNSNMKNLLTLIPFAMVLLWSACSGNQKTDKTSAETTTSGVPQPEMLPAIASMDAAHHVSEFHQKPAIAFDIELFFGGQKRMTGKVYSATNSSGIRVEKNDGTTLIYDGKKVWQLPADAENPSARFDMFTWQYFFMAPFKFNDPGTNWTAMPDATMNGKTFACAKLTFDKGTGDSSNDWYIAYQDQDTKLLDGLAYIVTFGGKPQETAEEAPHAITYADYTDVDGIPIATTWKFWSWTPEKGMQDQIGEANISNIHFVEIGDLFATPENGKEVSL